MSVTERDNRTGQPLAGGGLKQGLEWIAVWFNRVAVAALLAMFALMVVDILSSKIFNRPITATVDVVSFLALLVASFSVARTILANRHIEVEFVANLLPQGARKILNTISSFLSLAFFMLIVWRSSVYAVSLHKTGESSLTQHIPLAPFALAIAVACIPAVLIYAHRTYRDTKEVR